MTPPTRSQIDAAITQPTVEVAYWYGNAWTIIPTNEVLRANPEHTTSADLHGVAFGASSGATCTVEIYDTVTNRAILWPQRLIRVRFGFVGSESVSAFVGIIRERTRRDGIITWACAGLDSYLATQPIFTPMVVRRLAATRTTITSQDNPDAAGYAGGLLNLVCWRCGGRPLEQAATYPDAVFYYTCHDALIPLQWGWVSGENAWDELQRVCKAVGGQMMQRPDGVLSYVNPLTFGMSTGTPYVFTASTMRMGQEQAQADTVIQSVRIRATIRRLRGEQVIYDDTTPRSVGATSTLTVLCDLDTPVLDYVYDGTLGAPFVPLSSIGITTIDGDAPPDYPSVYAQLLPAATGAGRATLVVTNNTVTSMVVSRIRLRGRPVVAIATETIVVGSGTPQLEMQSDIEVYVQSPAHAWMLGQLYLDFYGTIRPTITFQAMRDPERYLGERCILDRPDWGYSMLPVRILARRDQETGSLMDLDVTDVSGLPILGDYFLVDGSYVSGTQKRIGY